MVWLRHRIQEMSLISICLELPARRCIDAATACAARRRKRLIGYPES